MEFRFKTWSTEFEWNQQNHMQQDNGDASAGILSKLTIKNRVKLALKPNFSKL